MLKGCSITVPDISTPLTAPYNCQKCHEVHLCKVYHLDLDGEGTTIVSPEVWMNLQRITTEFFMENEVKKPPTIFFRL
jgi:hypothetical protein